MFDKRIDGLVSTGLVEEREGPLVATGKGARTARVFGLFVHAALFFGGWLQVYNLAERGFSLRILIDIDESPGRALSPEEEEAGYGGGLGMGWMLDKRIEGLLSTRLMVERDGSLLATHKGVRVARLFGGLRAFLQIDTPQ